jgi:hypothetical protein
MNRGTLHTWRGLWSCLLAGVVSGTPMTTHAGPYDLNLSRLCRLATNSGTVLDCGRPHDLSRYGGLTDKPIRPDHESFRSLMSELGVVFAPSTMEPAETVGFAGFQLSAEFGFTSINPRRNANPDDVDLRHRFWRAAESVSDETFALGDSIYDPAVVEQIDTELPSGMARTFTLMARKGLWLPAPSMELGAGVKHLFGSNMWAGLVTAKLALHEGFQGMTLPAIAIRGAASHVFGTSTFTLTTAGIDVSVSKAFGVASTFTLTPYGGYQALWIIAQSGVIDALPNQTVSDLSRTRHFTFLDEKAMIRHHGFVGLRANLFAAMAILEFSYFAAGSSRQQVDIPGLLRVEVEDEAGPQVSINLSIGADF